MRIEQIKIRNFHCYEDETFDFSDSTTILIGKNGSGKSSLLRAIKNALSIFFSSNPQWGYPPIVGDVTDLGVSNLGTDEIWHDERMTPAPYVDISVNAKWGEKRLDWSYFKPSKQKSKLHSTLYKDAYIAFMQQYRDTDYLPMFAYYSDRFPHIDTKLGEPIKKMIDNNEQLYRGWGYYHWDYDTHCTAIWQKRFMRIYLLRSRYRNNYDELQDKGTDEALFYKSEIDKYSKEIDYVCNYLKRFTNNDDPNLSDQSDYLTINNLIVDGIDTPYIVAIFSDGSRRRWDELPAGFERLFNIVFDIAYRSYILNGADAEAGGIVMIDELDLHLHPSMEQDAIYRLTTTFPNVQFIISTHSPLVISNFRQANGGIIIQMERTDIREYTHYQVSDIFGMGYDMTLSLVMRTEPNNAHLQMLKDRYIRLMRRGKTERASETLDELRTYLTETLFNKTKAELTKAVAQS